MSFDRSSGVLMHITSLPSPHGIGTLGQAAFDFVDFLRDAGQRYWQVLPLGHTGFGDSPYQCYSAAAGNPLMIALSPEKGVQADMARAAPFSALLFAFTRRYRDGSVWTARRENR